MSNCCNKKPRIKSSSESSVSVKENSDRKNNGM